MNSFNVLLNKIENAKSLDFGDLISESIELFKKIWLKGFLAILIIGVAAFLISLVFNLIGLANNMPTTIFTDDFDIGTFSAFYASNVLYSIPQSILIATITLALVAAFYRICNNVVSGSNEEDNYFYFFSKEQFRKVFMLGIIYTAIATVSQLLFLIPYIYAFVPLSYFAVVLANNPELSESEIVKASFALGNKKWLITFGTMLVAFLLGMLGIIACFIGLLFTISFVYLPSYLIYKEVVGIDDLSEIEQIGSIEESDY